MVGRLAKWFPSLLSRPTLTAVVRGRRVVPKDGFPAVGWCDRTGAYVCAAHSGVTLSPLLGAAVAAEVLSGGEVGADVLAPWRPDRPELRQ